MNTRLQSIQRISHLLSNNYVPESPNDFIGDTRTVAEQLARNVADAFATGCPPLRYVINGKPGIGKSALLRWLQVCIKAHPKWSTFKFSGTQVKIETVEELARQFHYRDLYGDYRLVWIDEADKIPSVAQVRFLLLLDEQPDNVAVAVTSNCKLTEFEERFQTRFQPFEPRPPTQDQVEQFLRQFPLLEHELKQIATFACGNVRQALNDALSALQAQPATTAA
ncbi:MAG: polymerase delta subunit [Verrucomicrobiota bacterium]|jgi:DNA polymerase III delta prime subunit